MKNKISDLRNHLFETIEALKCDEKPMEVARAIAISEVAQTIINTAKLEIQFIEAVGTQPANSEFFEATTISGESKPRLVAGAR